MSDFAVKVCQIGAVYPHTNADRLELARLTTSAYQFVVPKGTYKAGDTVLYFPLDALLPQELIVKLGLDGKLSGIAHNRVKTVKLRGEISQGIVAPASEILTDIPPLGTDVAELLGVTKYEPTAVLQKDGNLVRLPANVAVYDIENAENYQLQLELLMDQVVVVTEKLEGSHWGISIDKDDKITVFQRHYAIIEVPSGEHAWQKVARTSGLRDKLSIIRTYLSEQLGVDIEVLTLRGELIGPSVQGNIYGLKEHEVCLFEIEVNGQPIRAKEFLATCAHFMLKPVPILSLDVTLRKWLNGKSLRDASNDTSKLADVRREGLVIKPIVEQSDPELGRLFLKQRSPEYLANEK